MYASIDGGTARCAMVQVSGTGNSGTWLLVAGRLTDQQAGPIKFAPSLADARHSIDFLQPMCAEIDVHDVRQPLPITTPSLNARVVEDDYFEVASRNTHPLAAGQVVGTRWALIHSVWQFRIVGCPRWRSSSDIQPIGWDVLGCAFIEWQTFLEASSDGTPCSEGIHFSVPRAGRTEKAVSRASVCTVDNEDDEMAVRVRTGLFHGPSVLVMPYRAANLTWTTCALMNVGELAFYGVPFDAIKVPTTRVALADVERCSRSGSSPISTIVLKIEGSWLCELESGMRSAVIFEIESFLVLLGIASILTLQICNFHLCGRTGLLVDLSPFLSGCALEAAPAKMAARDARNFARGEADSEDLQEAMQVSITELCVLFGLVILNVQMTLCGRTNLQPRLASLGIPIGVPDTNVSKPALGQRTP